MPWQVPEIPSPCRTELSLIGIYLCIITAAELEASRSFSGKIELLGARKSPAKRG
jgi:hypothetical protein